jgi:hypothetical protein
VAGWPEGRDGCCQDENPWARWEGIAVSRRTALGCPGAEGVRRQSTRQAVAGLQRGVCIIAEARLRKYSRGGSVPARGEETHRPVRGMAVGGARGAVAGRNQDSA